MDERDEARAGQGGGDLFVAYGANPTTATMPRYRPADETEDDDA